VIGALHVATGAAAGAARTCGILLRQLRPAAQAQVRDRRLRRCCNAPEINCIALVGVIHDGGDGFAVLVGGGLSSVPRLAREMGVFVPKDEAVTCWEQ
jgi:Nitrite and sulphite reductase 4Fe-4S domain